MKKDIIIKDTHRAVWYEDGEVSKVLGPGRYRVPRRPWFRSEKKHPIIELQFVDVREQDFTIKGQEILTADKVAIRVSIIVQFKVADPVAALHNVNSYADRLYSDVQLSARRSLASMSLEQILTNRNQLSEGILDEVKVSAASFGVSILRADVKDLIFPGNLQEVMNKVLTAERLSEAKLVESRTLADQRKIEAEAQAATKRIEAELSAETDAMPAAALAAARLEEARAEAEALRIKTEAEQVALHELAKSAEAYAQHPALLRLRKLEALGEAAKNANARIFLGFDKHADLREDLKTVMA
ncbi:MAG: hypothetical protein SynsKO_32690 [Synoicihabitans sp.]